MHELSIAKEIISIAEETISQHPGKKVKNIYLTAGVMSNILPESLSFSFNSLKELSSLEKAELIINEIPVSLKCKSCGYSFSSSELLFVCSKCGNSSVEVISGNELYISQIEID